MVKGFYINLPLLVNLLNIVYYIYIVFCCLCIISGSLDGVNIASVDSTGGEPTPGGVSNPGGGPTPGGVPNPGGGPNPPQDPNTLGVVQSSGLPKEDSKSSLWSDVSYTTDDLRQAAGSELVNIKNILNDKSLSEEQRTDKVLEAFTKVHNELVDIKRELANLKKSGYITIGIKKE
jgi:hypothetical protein